MNPDTQAPMSAADSDGAPLKRLPGSPRARTSRGPEADLVAEVRRLHGRCRQHELAVERLTEAVLILRRGTEALKAENRDLRLELQGARRARWIQG